MARVFAGRKRGAAGPLIPVLFSAAVLVLAVLGVANLSRGSQSEQLALAQSAVRRSAVQCYAIEGRYPNSLDYLQEHYGLILNRDKFVYHYANVGATLMPEISVFPKEN